VPRSSGDSRDARAILDAIRRIVRALRVSSRRAQMRLGLSGAQLFVLQKLADGQTMSLNELADRTLTHQSSVSVVVQRLVDRGLVRRARASADARRLKLSLTAAGRALLERSPGAAQDRLLAGIAHMPPAGRRRLAGLLEDLVMRSGISEESASLFFEDSPDRRSRGRNVGDG
jgi:DNA-binding MarR family transcriptional regulator